MKNKFTKRIQIYSQANLPKNPAQVNIKQQANNAIKLTHGKTIISKSSSNFIFFIQFLLATNGMLYKVEGLRRYDNILEKQLC